MILAISQRDRHLAIPGTHNFRDAGGYETLDGARVRWRTLFRSDSLEHLTHAGQEALVALDLRTVVDLRRSEDLVTAPNPFAHCTSVCYLHNPLFERRADGSSGATQQAQTLESLYRRMLERHASRIAGVLENLALPGRFPAVIHCFAGKDRTGLIIALLLSLVGVSSTDIASDYALSERYLAPAMDTLRQHCQLLGYEASVVDQLLGSRAEAMLATLSYLDDHYGGSAAYLRANDVADEKLSLLRLALVER